MSVNDNKTRLYLNIQAMNRDELDRDITAIMRMTSEIDIACVALWLAEDVLIDMQLKPLIARLQEKQIAVLLALPEILEPSALDEQLAGVQTVGADGIHLLNGLAVPDILKKSRAMLGEDMIIGGDCGVSRHHSMALGEVGADYIAFSLMANEADEQLAQMTGWWQDLFEIPCVASNPRDQDELEELLQIGAEFIALGGPLWLRLRDDQEFLAWMSGQCPVPERAGQE